MHGGTRHQTIKQGMVKNRTAMGVCGIGWMGSNGTGKAQEQFRESQNPHP